MLFDEILGQDHLKQMIQNIKDTETSLKMLADLNPVRIRFESDSNKSKDVWHNSANSGIFISVFCRKISAIIRLDSFDIPFDWIDIASEGRGGPLCQ